MAAKKTEIERLLSSVQDSTQFPTNDEAPGLRDLDIAMSCGICSDPLQGPMMLPCGHSFCSLCIRTSLRDRSECPQCRSKAEEMNLLKNVTLEEVSLAWQLARPFILQLIDEKQKLEVQVRDERPKKRRRTNGSSGSVQSARTDASPNAHESNAKPRSADHSDSEQFEIEEIRPPRQEVVPSSDTEENVHCPVCKRRVRMSKINQHLDSGCKSHMEEGPSRIHRSKAKSAWKGVFGNEREKGKTKDSPSSADSPEEEKLPKRSYDMLSTKRVKELLQEAGLPTNGTRDQLSARHGYYVTLYNANLDILPSHRKSLQELRKDLRNWEDAQVKKKFMVDNTHEYLKSNSDMFKEHVAAAKASAMKQRTHQNDARQSNDASGASHVSESPHTPRIKSNIRSEEVVPDSDDE